MRKKKVVQRVAVGTAVQNHKKRTRHAHADWDRSIPVPAHLVAKPTIAKSKHQTYYEIADNTDKKKKLEFEITDKKQPSANFTFIPVGNPELTNACKELSREEGALIYIVSGVKEQNATIGEHVHRIGYHFRSNIVERAAASIGAVQYLDSNNRPFYSLTSPDVIPDTQEEINKQADAAIRDLFPRVPNTDREMIVRHAFQKGAVFNGKPVVGLQEELSLSRRVQLAVLAHIRHTHTRYDELLRETSWENARRAVESLCLDLILKWRGDEETGRDQLDEVLREIVVISDTEEDDSDDEGDDEDSSSDDSEDMASDKEVAPVAIPSSVAEPRPSLPAPPVRRARINHIQTTESEREGGNISSRLRTRKTKNVLRKERRNRKGFKRYDKRYETAWKEALNRRKPHKDLDAPAEFSALASIPGLGHINESLAAPPGFKRPLRVYNEDPLDDSVPANAHKRRSVPRQKHDELSQKRLSSTTHDNSHSTMSFGNNGPSQRSRPLHGQQQILTYQNRPSLFPAPPEDTSRPSHDVRGRPVRELPRDLAIPSVEPQTEAWQGSQVPNSYHRGTGDHESQGLRYVENERPYEQSSVQKQRPQIIYIDEDAGPLKRRRVTMDGAEGQYMEPGAYGSSREHQIREQNPSHARLVDSAHAVRTEGPHHGRPIYMDEQPLQRRPQRIVRVITVPDEQEPPPLAQLSLDDRSYNAHSERHVRDRPEYVRPRVEAQHSLDPRTLAQPTQRYFDQGRRAVEPAQPPRNLQNHPGMNYQTRVALDHFPSSSSLSAFVPPVPQDSAYQHFSYPTQVTDSEPEGHILPTGSRSSIPDSYYGPHGDRIPIQRPAHGGVTGQMGYMQDYTSHSDATPQRARMQPEYRHTDYLSRNLEIGDQAVRRDVRRPDGVIVLDR